MIQSVTFILAWSLLGAMEPPPAVTPPIAAPAQPFQLFDFGPRRFAYIEHTGPYWSLGTAIERVSQDAKAFDRSDFLIVRYVHDPALSTPGRLKTQIGFELSGIEEARPPYQSSFVPAALTATRTVDGPDGLSTRHFAALKVWALTQGLVPDGDLIALVTLSENGKSTAIARSELFLPVCLPDSPPAPAQAQPEKTVENPADFGELLAAPRLDQPRRLVTKVIPLIEPDQGEVAQKEPGEPSALSDSETVVAEVTPPVSAPPVKARSDFVPIRAWIEAGQFQEACSVLLSDKADPQSHQWSDQFAARIIAVANGVHKQWPGEEGWLAELGATLTARRNTLRREGAKTAPRLVVAPGDDSKTPERKALTRELDLLMGQIAYRTLSPVQVRERLLDLLEAAVALELP